MHEINTRVQYSKSFQIPLLVSCNAYRINPSSQLDGGYFQGKILLEPEENGVSVRISRIVARVT